MKLSLKIVFCYLEQSILTILALSIVFILAVVAISKLSFAPHKLWWIDGISYLPDLALYPLLLLLIAIFGLCKRYLLFFCLGVTLITHFACLGDVSWQALNHKTNTSKTEIDLRLMALNLRYWSFGVEQILSAIKSHRPDFVLVSENAFSQKDFVAIESLKAPYNFYYGRQSETGIFTTHKAIEVKEIEFSSRQASLFNYNEVQIQSENTHRAFLHATFNIDGRTVNVISVRFVAGRGSTKKIKDQIEWGKYLLQMQIIELKEFTKYLKNISGEVLFGGDLNATPGSIVVGSLLNYADDIWAKDHFFGIPTFSTLTALAFLRLDYLFYRGLKLELVKSYLSEDFISDHYALFGDFRWKK